MLMPDFVNPLLYFFLGGAGYVGLELLFRKRSHYSMFLAGGASLSLLVSIFTRYSLPLPIQCLLGGLVITALEFITGYLFNLRLGREVWDYSGHWGNLYGQICPLFTLIWVFLCLPIALLCRALV